MQYYGAEKFYTWRKMYKALGSRGCYNGNADSLRISPDLRDACERLRSDRAVEGQRLSEVARESHVREIAAERKQRQSTRQVGCRCRHSSASYEPLSSMTTCLSGGLFKKFLQFATHKGLALAPLSGCPFLLIS